MLLFRLSRVGRHTEDTLSIGCLRSQNRITQKDDQPVESGWKDFNASNTILGRPTTTSDSYSKFSSEVTNRSIYFAHHCCSAVTNALPEHGQPQNGFCELSSPGPANLQRSEQDRRPHLRDHHLTGYQCGDGDWGSQ
jgi:hypothetical protein